MQQSFEITIVDLPPDKKLASDITNTLTSAFEHDRAMLQLLGRGKWDSIRHRYFSLQIDCPDTILTISTDNQIKGVLLVSSPRVRRTFWQMIRHTFGMMWLLGRHYAESQRIAMAVATGVPPTQHWYINQLAVVATSQGSGLGSALLQQLTRLTGKDEVYVDCDKSLARFYGNAGFETIAARPEIGMIVMSFKT
jgi:ribosomal protein S18 acetylase RimI-like enzyme